MANNFGGAQYGMNPGNNVSGWNNAIPAASPSLSIMPSNSREFSEQYPLAPNATMVFINYNVLGTALTDLRKEFEALKKQFDEFVK